MWKTILLVMFLSAVNLAQVAQAQSCDKCCGAHVISEISHRICNELDINCHVTRCAFAAGLSACCWSVSDKYVDFCSDCYEDEQGGGCSGDHFCYF